METVIVAILSLIGTLVGTYAGIVSANKVTEWRIKQVESKICTLSKQVEELTAIVNYIQGEMEVLHDH